MHYFGPTEAVYVGNIDDICAEDDEIESLLAESNYLLPGLNIKRSGILFTWAGVRPLIYDPALPMGKRSRDVHHTRSERSRNARHVCHDGGTNYDAPLGGRRDGLFVKKRLKPSRPAKPVDYSARRFPDHQNSPPSLDDWTAAKLSDLAYATRHEHAMGLVDLMFRRVGAGWTKTMGYKDAEKAARAVAEVCGWDAEKTKQEAEAYHAYLKRMHAVKVG